MIAICSHRTRQHIGQLAKETGAKLKSASDGDHNNATVSKGWIHMHCHFSFQGPEPRCALHMQMHKKSSCRDFHTCEVFVWLSVRKEFYLVWYVHLCFSGYKKGEWCKAGQGLPGSSCWVPECAKNCSGAWENVHSLCCSSSSSYKVKFTIGTNSVFISHFLWELCSKNPSDAVWLFCDTLEDSLHSFFAS